ncbi:MAG TPA: hypothetical protein VI320_03735 [Terracidiphilus sp.]
MWRKFVEFTGVVFGQGIKDLLPFGSEFQYHPAPVVCILLPRYQSSFFASFAEFDNGIVAQAEPLCDITDRCQYSIWNTGDLEQQLMLLWLETGPGRRLLAELKKNSQLVPEVRKSLDPESGSRFHRNSHELIISYYDIYEAIHD